MDLLKNLDNMITAENFFNQYGGYTREEMLIRAREFAKLHVKAALKEASEKAEWKGYTLAAVEICDYSILDAYPLENIK